MSTQMINACAFAAIFAAGILISIFILVQWHSDKKLSRLLLALVLVNNINIICQMISDWCRMKPFTDLNVKIIKVDELMGFVVYCIVLLLSFIYAMRVLEKASAGLNKIFSMIGIGILVFGIVVFLANALFPFMYSLNEKLELSYTNLYVIYSVLQMVLYCLLLCEVLARIKKLNILDGLTVILVSLTIPVSYIIYMYTHVIIHLYLMFSVQTIVAVVVKEIEIAIGMKKNYEQIVELERKQAEDRIALMKAEMLEKDMAMAAKIQLDSLPKVFPPYESHEDILLFATMRPQREVGGDFYDCFEVDANHVCFLIADVAGKGIPGALFMMKAKTIIRNYAKKGIAAKDIITKANKELCEDNKGKMFATVWMGILDTDTLTMQYTNAGHNPPFFGREGGNYKQLKKVHGCPVGLMPDMVYEQSSKGLMKGDRLFLYTDGVTESRDESATLYGDDRLKKVLEDNASKEGKYLLEIVQKSVDEYAGNMEQFDDITMMVLDI